MGPQVLYAKKPVKVSNASWNMAGASFSGGAAIRNWSYVAVIQAGAPSLRLPLSEYAKAMWTQLQAAGLKANPPQSGLEDVTLERAGNVFDVIDRMIGSAKQRNLELLFIVLPEKNKEVYARIKFCGDVKWGIHTICCVVGKIDKQDRSPGISKQYLGNVALKFNQKLGGINQQLSPGRLDVIEKGETMVIGIDVTHPSPGSQRGAPSIAGMVASVDRYCGQWPASLRAQQSAKEMVTDIKEMVIERIRVWELRNRAKPKNILIYRDGVSEGQYEQVLDQEGKQVDDAIAAIYPPKGLKPKVTIVVVGKRHHTRFYPTQLSDVAIVEGHKPGNGNPKPGTVVDRGVTSERYWDFFLQAHHGLKGTARPAHYVVIRNDMKFMPDQLEGLVCSAEDPCLMLVADRYFTDP